MTTLQTSGAEAETAPEALPSGAWPITGEPPSERPDAAANLAQCIRDGQEFLFSIQREDLFWCAELESNPTITSEYVLLYQALGLDLSDRKDKLIAYFLNEQKDDGGWGITVTNGSDVSTTAEAYLALRVLGLPTENPHLRHAENFILGNGGLERIRIFTRIFFAMFGLIPWSAIPALPPEFILLPPQGPLHIYSLASWARGTMIPLFVIFHHKPTFALPNGSSTTNDWLDHLWINKDDKKVPYKPSWWTLLQENALSFETLFCATDIALKYYDPVCVKPIRKWAVEKCIAYILDHQEPSGDWGGIFPPMINGIIALSLHGYSLDSDPVKKGLDAIEGFSWEDQRGFRIQACVSPVWDTALTMISLLDCQSPATDPRLQTAAEWLLSKQNNGPRGDWRVHRPSVEGGGWSFEYHNSWYPDIDDTAAVLLALLRQDSRRVCDESILRPIEWILAMQNRDGGWAAFDVDNDKLYLNKIPFSDMDSLCDTSCPDITGRILELFGTYLRELETQDISSQGKLKHHIRLASEKALAYLQKAQEKNGSWFGRWGVNYIYGTSNVLSGLAQIGVSRYDPMVSSAVRWLLKIQNQDGGWGESPASYEVKSYVASRPTASQTAWALIGLLPHLSTQSEPVERGIQWLLTNQVPAPSDQMHEGGRALPIARGSTWNETESTGTGFPQHFYLRYHLYRHYFPMMALGRYLKLRDHE